MLTPEIGDQVWFWPSPHDRLEMMCADLTKPMASTIAFVQEDGRVTLAVLDHRGRHHERLAVQILEGREKSQIGVAQWPDHVIHERDIRRQHEEMQRRVEANS